MTAGEPIDPAAQGSRFKGALVDVHVAVAYQSKKVSVGGSSLCDVLTV
jgi:hypothetical protein